MRRQRPLSSVPRRKVRATFEIFLPALHVVCRWTAPLYEVSWHPAGLDENLHGYKELKEFIGSLKKPR